MKFSIFFSVVWLNLWFCFPQQFDEIRESFLQPFVEICLFPATDWQIHGFSTVFNGILDFFYTIFDRILDFLFHDGLTKFSIFCVTVWLNSRFYFPEFFYEIRDSILSPFVRIRVLYITELTKSMLFCSIVDGIFDFLAQSLTNSRVFLFARSFYKILHFLHISLIKFCILFSATVWQYLRLFLILKFKITAV